MLAQELVWDVGLSSERTLINAQGINAGDLTAPTVLYVAGLRGSSQASEQVKNLLTAYTRLDPADRPVNLITIAIANPQAEMLRFPPTGKAFAENPVSHALWRWIGAHAPDLVVLESSNDFGLAAALENREVAGFGQIATAALTQTTASLDFLLQSAQLAPSPAREEVRKRRARTPQQLAEQLAQFYGEDFATPAYVPGMSLIGRMRIGQMDTVTAQLQTYLVDGDIDVANASIMAGQLVFAEYAERTGNASAIELVVNAVELAFDPQGQPLAEVPMHNEMSDSVFMATPLLVKAAKLTGDTRYLDMAAQHLGFMQTLLLRDDGLYRHSPEADVAWSRGNGFPALGLALSLSDFPENHAAFSSLLEAYRQLIEALVPFQDADGMWHEVIDYPGSFAEITATAMIGMALKRGIDQNWLPAEVYQPVVDSAWDAVNTRTSFQNEFLNACASTGKMSSLDAYLDRPAILGHDDRAGGMVMNFANAMAGNP